MYFRRCSIFCGLVIVMVTFFAMATYAKQSPGNGGASTGRAAEVAPNDDEALQFAKSFEATVRAGDLAAVNAAIDWDAVLNRAVASSVMPEEIRRQFAAGVKSRQLGSDGFASQVIAQGIQYHFLRIHRQNGEQRALFRLHGLGKGVNYHDVTLVRQANGKLLIDDIFVYLTGERLSEALHRVFLLLFAQDAKPLPGALTQLERDYLEHLDKLSTMAKHVQAGRGRQAMEIYNQMPDSLKKDRAVLMLRLKASASLGWNDFDAAIREFRSAYSDNACLDYLLMDSYFLHKQYDKARASIDLLDRSLGGDPYLNVLRANSFGAEGQYKTAKEYARKAIEVEADLLSAYFSLLTISLKEKDFEETSRLLMTIREKSPKNLPEVSQLPIYAEYRKSPQYKAWLKTTGQ